MNKRIIISSLNEIANELDDSGLYSEAHSITNMMKKLAMELDYDNDSDETRPEGYQPNFEARQSPTRGVNNPEDERLVQKSHELLQKAKKLFNTSGDNLSAPQIKLNYLDREYIEMGHLPAYKRLPDTRITDFGDNVGSEFKYEALLRYLDEFYKICQANVIVKINDLKEDKIYNMPEEMIRRQENYCEDFLNEIQEFISEVEMIASENEDSRI
jgi:hypothetical protein